MGHELCPCKAGHGRGHLISANPNRPSDSSAGARPVARPSRRRPVATHASRTARTLVRALAVSIAAGVFLAMAGAFGTGAAPLAARFSYWLTIMPLASLIARHLPACGARRGPLPAPAPLERVGPDPDAYERRHCRVGGARRRAHPSGPGGWPKQRWRRRARSTVVWCWCSRTAPRRPLRAAALAHCAQMAGSRTKKASARAEAFPVFGGQIVIRPARRRCPCRLPSGRAPSRRTWRTWPSLRRWSGIR